MQLDPKTARVRCDAAKLAKVLPYAADSDVRYYLNGVCIRPDSRGGVLVIATDGSTLYCVRDPAGVADKETILPLNRRRHTRYLKADHQLIVDAQDNIWVNDRGGNRLWVSPQGPVDGKFPKLEGLVGDLAGYAEGLHGGFQRSLLQRMLDASGQHGMLRCYTATEQDGKPGKLLFVTGADSFGIVMPMRSDHRLDTVIPPEFLPQKAEPAPVAEAAHAP